MLQRGLVWARESQCNVVGAAFIRSRIEYPRLGAGFGLAKRWDQIRLQLRFHRKVIRSLAPPADEQELIPTASPQHQLRDLQGVEGSSLQELVATAPER